MRTCLPNLLTTDGLSLGIVIRQARTIEVGALMRSCGFDWLMLDLEHGAMTLDVATQISAAAIPEGIYPLVRVPAMELSLAARALDNGAMGIVMPHVDAADQARVIASALRYPPIGHRSYTSGLPHFGFAQTPIPTAMLELNRSTLVAVMLETPEAIGNAEEIAEVPGIDVLMVGCVDLSIAMGVPGHVRDPRIRLAVEKIVSSANRAGKHVAIGGLPSADEARQFVDMGVRMLLVGTDLGMLASAASRHASDYRLLA